MIQFSVLAGLSPIPSFSSGRRAPCTSSIYALMLVQTINSPVCRCTLFPEMLSHHVLQTAACTTTTCRPDTVATSLGCATWCRCKHVILVLDGSVNSGWNTSGQVSINAAGPHMHSAVRPANADPEHLPNTMTNAALWPKPAPRSVALCQHLTQQTAGAPHAVLMRARAQMRFCCLYPFMGRQ